MIVITLLNEKGGVGKTTLATHMAAGMASRGHSTLLIDSDPQGHAALALGMLEVPALYNLLVRDGDWAECLQEVPRERYENGQRSQGKLMLVASNIETRAIPLSMGDPYTLNDRLRNSWVEDEVGIVIIDTSPTPSLLQAAILLASDYVIIPTKCEYLSFDGLAKSMRHIKEMSASRQGNGMGPLEVAGIVPMMYRGSTLEHRENMDKLTARFTSLVWKPIPLRTVWPEAVATHKPVWLAAPDSEAALECYELLDKVEAILNG